MLLMSQMTYFCLLFISTWFSSYSYFSFSSLQPHSVPASNVRCVPQSQGCGILRVSLSLASPASSGLPYVHALLPGILPWRTPVGGSRRQAEWRWTALSFCLSRKVFISPSILKDGLARYSFLGWRLFLSALRMRFPTAFSLWCFCWEIS